MIENGYLLVTFQLGMCPKTLNDKVCDITVIVYTLFECDIHVGLHILTVFGILKAYKIKTMFITIYIEILFTTWGLL